jgi:prepilin-type N-terminal cleavage/methylation domain-containing protein
MRARRHNAFTITELLVVIAIIVLLIAIAVPAFSGLMGSSERNLAENQLKAAIAAARDAAIQSETGDAAAVFFYNVSPSGGGGHITIVPCLVVGSFDDVDDPANVTAATPVWHREVLVPISTIEPTQLPRGWSVRGFAPPGTLYSGQGTEPWYELYLNSGTAQARQNRNGNWVFPETAFCNSNPAISPPPGSSRQSFMVRFKAGTGVLDTGDVSTALVFDPWPDPTNRTSQSPWRDYRPDQLILQRTVAPNATTWVRRFLPNRVDQQTPDNDLRRRKVLGDSSMDTVLVRPVTELSLYLETKMAASIGAGALNRNTGSVYADKDSTGQIATHPTIDLSLFSAGVTEDKVCDRIDKWIMGKYHVNDTDSNPLVSSDARVFTIDNYLGQVQELVP